YMLGGRDLGPGVAALSAGAADMSGWLLMGLPGALYLNGLIEGWIAVGLTLGAWLNWKFTAPRLRAYSKIASNSITVPSFLGQRLRDTSNIVRIVAG
ncbi:sodium:proline symporter, partial [Winkia sp. UMB3105]|nr:sodium:proline symporter [Winkia sp. UMB3105]